MSEATNLVVRDLGEELDTLPDEIRDIVNTYGHGDCHYMTQVLIEEFNFIPMAVMAEDSGMAVHSAVRLSGNRTFDAYGINTIERTLERYRGCCMDYLESDAYIQEVDEKYIVMHAGITDEDLFQDVKKDVKKLLAFLEIDPVLEAKASREETVTQYIQ